MCKELKLIIEVDGITHSYGNVVQKDKVKTRNLESQGFTILRYTDEEVLQHIEHVRESIMVWIENNAVVPPPGPRQLGNETINNRPRMLI